MQTYSEDSASDKEGDECAAAESLDDIVDETIPPSPAKIRARIKSRKVIIPAVVLHQYCALTLRTKNIAHGLASVLMPVQPRYARMVLPNTSAETRIRSQALPARRLHIIAARKGRAGSRG